MATFEEKIAELHADVVALTEIKATLEKLIDRNTEASEGESMLIAAEVLVREAIGHFEEAIEMYAGNNGNVA